jgi:DNA-binding PadR family transcriptional regulator
LEQIQKKYIPMTETTYYTLLALREDRHGYAIMQFVSELTENRIRMGTGTLYTMLGRLVEDGLITIVSNENGKKVYHLTRMGEDILKKELARLRKQLKNGEDVYGKQD